MAVSSDRETPPPFPERVGRYELLLPLGTGGMATVYLARATGAGGFAREVALKLLHAHLRGDEDSKLHLLEEAKLAARIRHPNVVPVLEVDEDPFGLYLVMEYVEGETLAGLVESSRKSGKAFPNRIAARIVIDALAGLQAAHELTDDRGAALGLVHRDFTPQNLLVGIDGTTRLSDFGVAKAAGRALRTKTGLVKGKVAYMAPEQARGRDVDLRCDVWAAGVVAWELIAGRRLFDSEDDVSTLLSVVTESPPLLSEVLPDVNASLEEAVGSALSPLEDRCPSAAVLRARLEAAYNQVDGVADPSEVSAFVRHVLGTKLASRRERIVEVRELRQRMGEIVRDQAHVTRESSTPDSAAETAAMTQTAIAVPRADPSFHPLPKVAEPSGAYSLEAAARRAGATRRRTLLVGAALAGLVASALLLLGRGRDAPEPSVAAPPAPSVPAVATLRTEAEPKTQDDGSEPPLQESAETAENATGAPATAAPKPSPSPARPSRATRARFPGRPAVTKERPEPPVRAQPRSQAPSELAEDPYGP